jgi:hypothetical protein
MDFTEQQLRYNLDRFQIPIHMHNGIIRWILDGIRPGTFLCAIVENNLKESIMRADIDNITRLIAYVNFFYNAAPGGCWGSVDKVRQWENDGGLRKIKSTKSLVSIEEDDDGE